jgi:hypothetical protein
MAETGFGKLHGEIQPEMIPQPPTVELQAIGSCERIVPGAKGGNDRICKTLQISLPDRRPLTFSQLLKPQGEESSDLLISHILDE